MARFFWLGAIAAHVVLASVGALRLGAGQVTAAQVETVEEDQGMVPGSGSEADAGAGSLRTPRDTMKTFLNAMVRNDLTVAISALDFSEMTPEPDREKQADYAKMLRSCIERIALVAPEVLSDAPAGAEQVFPPEKEDAIIRIVRNEDQQWRFSAGTIAKLPALYDVMKDQPKVGDDAIQKSKPIAKTVPEAESSPETSSEVSAAPEEVEVPSHLYSARRVMRALFDSLDEKKYGTAVSTLDFSKIEKRLPELGPYGKLELTRQLRAVIERMQNFDYGEISDDPNGVPFLFPLGQESQPIAIVRAEDGTWKFSADTVDSIESLFEIFGTRAVKERPWYRRVIIMGNEVWRILLLFGVIFLSLLIGRLVRMWARARSRTMKQRQRLLSALTLETVGKTLPVIIVLFGLAIGLENLTLGFTVSLFTGTILHIIITLLIGYICFRLVDVVVGAMQDLSRRSGSTLNDMLTPIVSTALRLTIIVLVMLEVFTAVSDKPPSAIIAGLGAGGLAIGLAAQDTIKNFFGSVLIFADRPFELGDRIVIDGHDGPVEAVGFRSTRIRTLDGHLVTVPNGEMASKTIQNIGKRPYIRRVMNIRLAYGTAPEKVRQALTVLRELLENHEGSEEGRPPRVFLHEFLESAVNVRAIYWYHPPNYWDFCDFGERLNLQILERFEAADLQFALPAQRIVVSDSSDNADDT